MAKKAKKERKPQIVLWRLRHDLRTNVIATHCSPHVDSFCWLYQGGVPLGNGYKCETQHCVRYDHLKLTTREK